MSISENIKKYQGSLPKNTTLVAVSKTKPVSSLLQAYDAGQRVFGENKIQEMASKWEEMPKDIQWHMIGHVQTNKVKYMAPFVDLIHTVDSLKLLREINKQAAKHDRVINCLLQIKIAEEEHKFGLDHQDALLLLAKDIQATLPHVSIVGLMGMASFTDNKTQIETEFKKLSTLHKEFIKQHPQLTVLSMGMSSDYTLALDHGSTMVRIGSSIFGARNYN
ncbi:YggS family pyridoxal phosphate-dependent enzyme [Flavobacteriaceae bacterium]|jgi:PLP dependent protein|nr:YggS family pyridoxal phosphate-dependent enzyme [Flavobacteriaceae bacterium]MDB4203529.1 YggS family pyridoxal phosphate-dependent enzyme [Flavobacteriaceae bacterium]MDC0098177.1 YggS family pyridoxal phosphate-dependent enzyme [Flavobacteriaceae bacterium]MDC0341677.1 YggS family pyridoxal phosphate-dependent enzyme [Flavobacteriaceae bacterium]